MHYPDAEILVMARAPISGEAKTRLIPALGKEGAAALHAALVERLLTELCEAGVAPITLCCTPETSHCFFQHCQRRFGVSLQQQQGAGLGERLHHALSHSLQQHRYAVVIGCDIPLLDANDINSAICALIEGEDAAITPTEDGGYALMALKRSVPELFAGVSWGGGGVMEETRERLASLGWHWRELRRLWDLDLPEDLPRLTALSLSPQVEDILKKAGLSQQAN